jgi:hypothetical protein
MQGAAEAISEMNASLFRGRKQKGIPDYRAIDVSAVACQSGLPCDNPCDDYREDLLYLTRSGYEKLTAVKEKLSQR